MNECEKYGILSEHFLWMIENIIHSEEKSIEKWIVERCIEYDDALKFGKIDAPCMNCSNCLDFSYYKKILYEFLQSEESKRDLEVKLHYWRKTMVLDNLNKSLTVQTDQSKFNRIPFTFSNSDILVYLDINIYNHFILKDSSYLEKIMTSKMYKCVQYLYSPRILKSY